MTGLKVMGAAWVATIASAPFIGTISVDSEKWMTGGPQVILALAVLGLSSAIAWAMRKLLKVHEQRVAEAKEFAKAQEQRVVEAKDNARQQVEQANRMAEQMTEALSENSTALSQNATTNKELKDSIYHLSSVVDKKLDKSV
jgi:predicted lipid-binding transport protein (Tim44 family)